MTNRFTLDDIKAAADRKYGSVIIELDEDTEVELVNALRMKKDRRKRLTDALDALRSEKDKAQVESAEDADEAAEAGDSLDTLVSSLEGIMRIVARTSAQGDLIVEAANGDAGWLMTVFDLYNQGAESGEASPSQD